MTLGLLRPLCPICGVRTQLLMRNGRWRGACPECWANRPGYTHDQAPEGSERIYRNVAQIKVGRRWVNKSRHLAKLAGVALEPDMRARMRDGVLEVSVWQAVDPVIVKGGPAGGGRGAGPASLSASAPTGTRKRAKRAPTTEVTWADDDLALIDRLAAHLGLTRAEVARWAVRRLAQIEPPP